MFGGGVAPAPMDTSFGGFGAAAPSPFGYGASASFGYGASAAQGSFGSPAPAAALYGATPTSFGAGAPAPASLGGFNFGAPAPAPSFGAPPAHAPAAPASSSFGALGPAPAPFGIPAPAAPFAFGAAPVYAPAAPPPQPAFATGGFGAQAPQAPAAPPPPPPASATGGFGAQPWGEAPPAPAYGGGFGAPPASATGGFGAQPWGEAPPAPAYGGGFGAPLGLSPNDMHERGGCDDDQAATDGARDARAAALDEPMEMVLRQVHPGTRMSRPAACVLARLLLDLLDRLGAHLAEQMIDAPARGDAHVRLATASVLEAGPGLAKHALAEGDKLVQAAASSSLPPTSVFCRGGGRRLDFIAVAEFRYQEFVASTQALMFVSAVLEYMCAEILELAGNVAHNYGRKLVSPEDIFEAIVNDAELCTTLIVPFQELPKMQPGVDDDVKI